MAEKQVEEIVRLMRKPEQIRNIGIVAHIDHGKTTMTDSLLAGAGMISEELASQLLVMDFHADEKERGITIDSASVNMVHELAGKKYLINLIDTPGHVDFSGEVTRAMRACDGAVVLVDAVEGMMPQTETVLRQALKERVKPVLFINKVDRLIRELKLTPEGMRDKFLKIINEVNKFLRTIVPEEIKDKWQLSVQEGSVAFGSAIHKWALSFSYMQSSKISFADILQAYEQGQEKELSKKAPLHKIILDMVVSHLPNPLDAQKYRIKKIWPGDLESETGKALINCSADGPVVFVPTKIVIDEHAGEVAGGRLFSGTVKKGQELWMNASKKWVRVQQVNLYKGQQRFVVDEAVAGNIIGLVGLKDVFAGDTVSSIQDVEAFESIKHLFEPVVTVSIEAKKASDLPRLVEVLRKVSKEDPTVKIEINEETGEHLISGMGELHLEVIANRIRTEKGVDITTSPPIVVYRESVQKPSRIFQGRTPNKHNDFFLMVEPLEEEIYELIKSGEIREGRTKKKDEMLWKALQGVGVDSKQARKYKDIFRNCVFIDRTRGIVHIGEVMEMCIEAFEQIMNAGPVANEPCLKIKASLMDTKLHEDAIHRGPAQVLPAVRDALREAIRDAEPVLYEPLQILQIESDVKFMGEVSRLIQNKRGQLLSTEQEGDNLTIRAKLPVAELFGFAGLLRGATEGRATFFIVDQHFQRVPKEIQVKVIKQIRERKGLSV
ncbi:elongation factor EF-2 [Candidatus Pacearchaeota archaeon ex4484_26]|nr:MAG: elongation factor EF-2 [Candidatus Pacearchaeota archaeon ex4484_26]